MSARPHRTRTHRRGAAPPETLRADVCVVGAGIAGVSAALEAARLGLDVVLVEGGPTLGGQSVGAMIGTFCGLYANGPDPERVTHGIADELLADLIASGDARELPDRRNTTVVQYRIDALERWVHATIARAGIRVLLGAVLRDVERADGRVTGLGLATRYGDVRVAAPGYVDASGDAVVAWLAGLPVREPADGPIFGTMMLTVGEVDDDALARLAPDAITERLESRGAEYGLVRHDGFAFAYPGAGETLVNMTHLETDLTAGGQADALFAGRRQCDALLTFLRAEFPTAFGAARVLRYGMPGVRQSRWIAGRHTLTAEEVRAGTAFDDAIARCSWPIELHDAAGHATWEVFGDDHMHQVPLRSLLPADVENLVAVGRCIDADVAALASVRVMGPCIAMGAAAAHALELAGGGSLHEVDVGRLQQRIAPNLGLDHLVTTP